MTKKKFHESRLKIIRANSHIEELNSCIGEFLKTDFYSLTLKNNPDTGFNFVEFTKKPLPDNIPLIIGDAVHNLRTALDFSVCEIVRNAGLSDVDTHFPFDKTRENLIDRIEKGEINRASPKIASLILNKIQPYETGNFFLWALNQLDRADKHRLLIPVVDIVSLVVCIEDADYDRFDNITIEVGENGILRHRLISDTFNMKIKSYTNPSFAIRFGKGNVFNGDSVVETINKLSIMVDSTISMFETV